MENGENHTEVAMIQSRRARPHHPQHHLQGTGTEENDEEVIEKVHRSGSSELSLSVISQLSTFLIPIIS